MMNENVEELSTDSLSAEEVNVYAINYQCGKIQYHCLTDCPFKLPFISKEY